MLRLTRLIAGLIAALACISSARAADPPGTWVPPPAVAVPRFTELLSGWYLRFDGGYRWNHIGAFDSAVPATSSSLKNSADATLGVGYKYHWMRLELTVDRGFTSSFSANTATAGIPQPQYNGKLASWTALASGYIDFGTWGGFTPYVGGGAGATLLQSESYSNSNPLLAVPNGSPQTERTNFSWAVMAGVAFQVAPNWLVDVGVRHLDLGSVDNTRAGGALRLTDSTLKNVTANEVRLGLRLLFD